MSGRFICLCEGVKDDIKFILFDIDISVCYVEFKFNSVGDSNVVFDLVRKSNLIFGSEFYSVIDEVGNDLVKMKWIINKLIRYCGINVKDEI